METQIMVPGILVALKTSVNGGVQYQRQVLDESDDGSELRWQTTRHMDDPTERKAAGEIASKAAGLVSRLCVRTSFGLLCRTDKEAELDIAVVRMREITTEWNRKAKFSFVSATAIKGRIADNDEEAIRAILEEANELLDRMDSAMSEADVKKIRDACGRARRLAEMMTPESSDKVVAAIASARSAARAIVKRGAAIGDKVQNAIIETEKESFDRARFSFLDDMSETIESLPSVNLQRGAELEIDEAPAESVEVA